MRILSRRSGRRRDAGRREARPLRWRFRLPIPIGHEGVAEGDARLTRLLVKSVCKARANAGFPKH